MLVLHPNLLRETRGWLLQLLPDLVFDSGIVLGLFSRNPLSWSREGPTKPTCLCSSAIHLDIGAEMAG